MLDQITNLVKQFGSDAVVNNPAIPNEQNEDVMNEASGSILNGLKEMANGGNISDLAGMLGGASSVDMNNPVVQELANKVSGNLGEKFGLSSEAAGGVAGSLIPQVLGGLLGKANDSNDSSFNMSDIVGSLTGGSGGGLMDMISSVGGKLGLDQDGDGQVGVSDAVEAVSKKSGGLGGLLGKLFGK
jgi:hypothetical protein